MTSSENSDAFSNLIFINFLISSISVYSMFSILTTREKSDISINFSDIDLIFFEDQNSCVLGIINRN